MIERPLAHAAQPRSSRLLDALVSSAPVGMAVFDAELRFVLLNAQAALDDGIPLEAHVGRTMRELVPEVAERVEPILRRVRDTGEAAIGVEVWGATPASPGEERRWIASYFPIPEDGSAGRVAAVAVEVTERRRLERSLREARERYRRFFVDIPAAVSIGEVVRDAGGEIADWVVRDVNAAGLREIGVPREALVDRRASQLLGGEEFAALLPICREVMTAGGVHQWEHAFALTGKTYLSSFFALDERSFVTASFDVTRRVQLEAHARRDAELLRLSEDAMIVWSAAGGIESWSRGAEELYGWTAQEARGRSPTELLCTAFPAPWREIDAELHARDRWSGELVHTTRDGRRVVVSARFQLLRGAGGAEHVLEVNRDVTARRRAEQRLREEAERKSAFLAVLSHELRNPLAASQNALLLLDRAEPGSARFRGAKEVIGRQLGHLVRLVDDLLDITRISHGKILLRRSTVDACQLVRRSCEDLRPLFEERGVALRHAPPAAPLWIEADPTRLAQIVGNLLTNGAKFTPAGGTVSLTLGASGDRCELRIRDDGPGIAPAELDRIFEPFAQADRTRGISEGGVGLGLALVKSLVELHGGSVHAASAGPELGAEFVVRLPLAAAPAEVAPARERRRDAGAGLSILVVDDNADAAGTLAELLELEGHTTRVVHDGGSALAACRASPPDVLVCDIGLPDMSGHDVMRELRAGERGRRIFGVALSGYAQPEDLVRAREAGFDAHLAKPPSLERLGELLARGRERLAAAGAAGGEDAAHSA